MIDLYYVGRFVIRGKRIDKLLTLAKVLEANNIAYNFKIFAEVDEQSEEYKMFSDNANFKFLGYKRDWVNYISEQDIMIFVTKYEGCPLSILEAYKKKYRKIAILRIPGIENYVSENCISDSVEQMADKLIKGQDLTNCLNLDTYFDVERFVSEVQAFYKKIDV